MEPYRSVYESKRILVTGGAGAIGSHLVNEISRCGAGVVYVLDDLSSSQLWNVPSLPNVVFIQGSILDEVKLKRVFVEKPQYVFHLAAFFANQNSVDYPEHDFMTNGLGTLRLLQYSQLAKVERFVFASSGSSFYGVDAPMPLKEEYVSLRLNTPYQITKMLGELYCNYFYKHYGLPVVKTRFFNSYGPGEAPGQYRNVIPNFMYWALKARALSITGTGEETRDFTFVGDLIDGILRAGYYGDAIGEEFNLASGVETRIIDLAQMINNITGNSSGVTFVSQRAWDTKNRRLASTDKARKILGYEPRTKVADGLVATLQWFRRHWEFIEKFASFAPGASAAVPIKTNGSAPGQDIARIPAAA
ncbi:MAG: NAD-dependent epimerase/dehydratase family protein [Elusimicrobia bacterium]|nr:NAD-dependent epimerase/dehydratase family protein [Elusimicrobiota bacterium]